MEYFNQKFPKAPTQPRPKQGRGERHATKGLEIEHASARRVHLP